MSIRINEENISEKSKRFFSALASYSHYSWAIRWGALLAGTVLSVNLATGAVVKAEDIDPNADKILRSMSDYLGSLPAFSVDADIDVESIDNEGQKLQLTSLGKIILERPNKFYLNRRNFFADVEIFFDGTTVTMRNDLLSAVQQSVCGGAC